MTTSTATAVVAGISCVECQRRKQKCNREFPCNHCLKRGVSHLCRFVSKAGAKVSKDSEHSQDSQPRTSHKRSLGDSDRDSDHWDQNNDDSGSDVDVSGALTRLGYLPHHHHRVLGQGPGPKSVRDIVEESDDEQSEELKSCLPVMPEKRYTDCLVDNWLNGANHQYYALYPPEFRTQYDGWWATPRNKVSPELTSLILRVCACSLHFIIEDSVRKRLETELNTDVLSWADRLHAAADKISLSIPPGKGGLVHVQQLFLTAFWFKSAEKWADAWHALSRAIRAANEIGLHQDSFSEGMSEFDREMRRRMWTILYLWDFALSGMLSRPLIINQDDCTVVMPTLTLENNPLRPDQPSPFRHMNLHCQLCLDMAAQLGKGAAASETKAQIAKRLVDAVGAWFGRLPAEYLVESPDTRWDEEFEWVVFQRRYLHLIGYMSLFSQLREFIPRNSGEPIPELELTLRSLGVDAALDLMKVSWLLFESMVSAGAKFHYAIFCIFDAATVLCSAFLQDEARNLPKRNEVLEAISKGLGMLAEVAPQSKTTASLYRILRGLLNKLPLDVREKTLIGVNKRVKSGSSSPPSSAEAPVLPSQQAKRLSKASPPVVRRGAQAQTRRSSTASTGSDSTLDSSNRQSRSPTNSSPTTKSSSTSQSSNAQAASAARTTQPPPVPVVPSNATPPHGTSTQSQSHVMLSSSMLPPSYSAPPSGYLPTTTAPVSSSILISPDGFSPSAGFPTGTTFQYTPTPAQAGPVSYSEPGWEPTTVSMYPPQSGVTAYHTDGFDNHQPEVLQYWGWSTLNMGNPVSWYQSPPGAVDGVPGGFNSQGDCGTSISTDDLSR